MSQSLKNKVAIITGASSGIGRAISLAFHKEGAKVVCADLSEVGNLKTGSKQNGEPLLATHEAIVKDGGHAIFVKANVTIAADMEKLINQAVQTFGQLDIMINNAGVAVELEESGPLSVWDFPEDLWDKTMQVNCKGVFLGCKYAVAQMMKQEPGNTGDRGWIVNIASIMGLVGNANAAAYVASKHAVVGLTKSVALGGAEFRIHCNAICPGWVQTPLTEQTLQVAGEEIGSKHPFRGLGRPDDIAKAAVFLASENNTWMTGSAVAVDGGYTCM